MAIADSVPNEIRELLIGGSASVAAWNSWRELNSQVRPDLRGADLSGADLRGANLSEANLSGAGLDNADLRGANLWRAYASGGSFKAANFTECHIAWSYMAYCNFDGAILRRARLKETNLTYSSFRSADLQGADLAATYLAHADLRDADLRQVVLEHALLIEAKLQGANFSGAFVYGLSAWKCVGEPANQINLVITPENEVDVTADNLNLAQFLYLLLDNQSIRGMLDVVTSKVVLILGRFTPERKAVLDSIRVQLRLEQWIPVLFDFDRPSHRNITETVSTLAHMARFVIADLTDARSIPQELQRIVPDLPSLPVQPIIEDSQYEYSMFQDLRDYPWVLAPYRYGNTEELVTSLRDHVILPAAAKVVDISSRRTAFLKGLHEVPPNRT